MQQYSESAGHTAIEQELGERLERVEQELDRQRRTLLDLHDFLNVAPEAIFFKDAQLRYTRVNRAGATLLGLYNVRDALGKDGSDLLTPVAFLGVRAEEERILRTGIPRVEETVSLEFANGRRVWVCETKYPLYNAAGRVEGLAVISKDVTAAREALERQRKLEMMVEQLQCLEFSSLIAGAVAHDINNYLIAVRVNAELAQRQMGHNDSAHAHLEQLDTAARHAADLIRHLIPQCADSFRPAPQALGEVAGELLRLLSTTLPRTVSLRFHAASDTGRVLGDSTQLRQVIMNLVLNAAQALPEQRGCVTIHVGRMHCTRAYLAQGHGCENAREGDYAYVQVADDGCGIGEHALAEIFTPFYSTKSDGRGVGLTVVMNVIRRHGGRLKVWSCAGEGSTFQALFPLHG